MSQQGLLTRGGRDHCRECSLLLCGAYGVSPHKMRILVFGGNGVGQPSNTYAIGTQHHAWDDRLAPYRFEHS